MRHLTLVAAALAVGFTPVLVSQAQAATPYKVSLSVTRTEIKQGDTVVFSGKVSPSAKGARLKVQFFDIDQGGNRWRTVATTTVKSGGAYAKTVAPRDGSTRYRVYKPSGSGLSGGASKTVIMRAYAWYKMANVPDVPLASGEQYKGQYGPQTVAGTPVTRYWASSASAGGRTRWLTLHTCKRVHAEVGLDDRSAAGADAQFRIHADQTRIASVRVKKGTMVTVDVAVPRAETGGLIFTAEARNSARPTYVNASKPRAYCAFPEDD
ncbi:hypothetical protein [Aeromicrobium chenweiae]|uniref:Glycosyl hydrolase family 98 putative carbohydrate-binding module domain-containing protein n=1 Tax=Aeromicrobium chenweiae TaxID=2079793 RepID=A0A2S0WRB9_9ACTN|nr:hypothetical protein [Aeromicrobium chenweiae]AWB93861.1 hypothetical protein C3E78_17500 [Aeromicrobium chenweiae]TGN30906.1 hypothetical protein E4L97_14915 [Aeromicrobium chenweiae]